MAISEAPGTWRNEEWASSPPESPGLWQEPVPNKAPPGPACVFRITWGISGEAVSKKHPETMAGIQSLILRNRIFQELPKGLASHLGAPTWLLSQQEAGTAWWRCHFTADTSHTTAPPPGTALPRFKPRTKILILPMSSYLLYQPCPSMFPHPMLGATSSPPRFLHHLSQKNVLPSKAPSGPAATSGLPFVPSWPSHPNWTWTLNKKIKHIY